MHRSTLQIQSLCQRTCTIVLVVLRQGYHDCYSCIRRSKLQFLDLHATFDTGLDRRSCLGILDGSTPFMFVL